MARQFRFRPRYRGVALTAIGVGGSLAAATAIVSFAVLPVVSGIVGLALGGAYLASPAWRLVLSIDDDGFEVGSAKAGRKFRVAWTEVVRVTASPTTHTCFVDGGTPARSVLVPGDGAPAAYDLEDKPALYAAILAHVPPDRVRLVETLDKAATPA